MRYLLMLAFGAFLVMPAQGDSTRIWSNRTDGKPDNPGGAPAYDSREGGEDVSTAIEIPGDVNLLPFLDTGATCDNADDYDEICPYSGSTAPDVVYRFTPSADIVINLDLCASAYDTKVYVYDADLELLGCNDDAGCGYSGWQSFLSYVPLTGGATYYIIVDGYGQSCGAYDLRVDATTPCVLECPPGAMIEGEPPCMDGYVDEFNSGCNNPGMHWSTVEAGTDGCATICGTSCTYHYNGLSYRDTDWYEGIAGGGPISFQCEAEFPLMMILFTSTNCSSTYDFADVPPCTPGEASFGYAAGSQVWFWIGPQTFYGVSESNYVFTVCGLAAGPTPVEETSWGQIKRRYRDGTRK